MTGVGSVVVLGGVAVVFMPPPYLTFSGRARGPAVFPGGVEWGPIFLGVLVGGSFFLAALLGFGKVWARSAAGVARCWWNLLCARWADFGGTTTVVLGCFRGPFWADFPELLWFQSMTIPAFFARIRAPRASEVCPSAYTFDCVLEADHLVGCVREKCKGLDGVDLRVGGGLRVFLGEVVMV